MLRVSVPSFIVLSIALLVSLPAHSHARAKKIVYNGCTQAQLESNFGKSCDSQNLEDLVNNRSYYHAMSCSGDEMACCTFDRKTNAVINCRRPPFSKANQNALQAPRTSGSVLSRGVEGEGDIGEETPIPSWMTEAWLKEHQNDKRPK